MDFSIILQSPEVRQIVQENLLERAFHDALFPNLMFRAEAVPEGWPTHSGDTQIFSAPGLITPKQRPLTPGVDPAVSSYNVEQWEAQLQQYGDTIDTHMPTSMQAIIDLFFRNAHQLGLSGGQALNRIVRNRMYNAALSGWTVADGAQSGTSLRVKRLNGFTRARRPTVSGAATVRFETVSAANPLPITVFDDGAAAGFNVIGFLADTPGDQVGPGVLTLDAGTTSVLDRAYVFSFDRSNIVRIGGGNKVDDVGASDTLTLAGLRAAVTPFWQNNVPAHADGRFHAHADPVSISQVYDDPEFQRLNTSLPDYVMYREFALGEILGSIIFRNTEAPIVETVDPKDGVTFSLDDPFAGELFNDGTTSGVRIHRVLVTAQGGVYEYFSDLNQLITEAGLTGKVADPRIVNNGIEIDSERIQLVIRAPLNRLLDTVATSWKFIGDWPVRTDAATGDNARFKRFITIEHGE
ncbi:hypothetical protein LCGC14_0414710 [marine sediment metagenome]|uniref:Uncharacterized protein n=1 Tax=marine sediment metagenome TaxID=412755 RepID=A0A0F9VES0_9ZZZZ